MKKFYDKLATGAILHTLFFIVLGVLMLIFPEAVIRFIVAVVAVYALVFGVVRLIIWLRARPAADSFDLASAVLLMAVGVLLFAFTKQVASILPIFVGVLLIISGIYQLSQMLTARRSGVRLNWVQAVFSVVIIVGGALGILNPFGSLALLFRVFGGVLLVMGLNELLTLLAARRFEKQQAAQEQEQDVDTD